MSSKTAMPILILVLEAAVGCASNGGNSNLMGASGASGAESSGSAVAGAASGVASTGSGTTSSGVTSSGAGGGAAGTTAAASTAASGDAASGAGCPAATPWAAGTAYAVGQIVSYNGAAYRCIQAHTSEPGWAPSTTPALWAPASCSDTGSSSGASASGAASGSQAGAGAASGGSSGTSAAGSTGFTSGPTSTSSGSTGVTGTLGTSFFFSAYKDTSINMNWNTNVIQTNVSGTAATLANDLSVAGDKAITLAFATGECGSENWAGVGGATMAPANVPLLTGAGVKYIVSTGGAGGSFTCGSSAGFQAFVGRWASPYLVGVDFDIEAGQSQNVIQDLVSRIHEAHASFPGLRFSLTLATLANNGGADTAQSLGASVQDSFNTYGDLSMAAVEATFGFNGNAATWPSYLTVNVMTMDYGSPSSGVCVVSGGACEMGQSALQAAYNLHDKWGVPYASIEITPMIGSNDVSGEEFTLQDADAVASFARSQGLAGIHYWSYDRDVDCAVGAASPTCNSMGTGYAGAHGYLSRFLKDGL